MHGPYKDPPDSQLESPNRKYFPESDLIPGSEHNIRQMEPICHKTGQKYQREFSRESQIHQKRDPLCWWAYRYPHKDRNPLLLQVEEPREQENEVVQNGVQQGMEA